MADVNRVSDPMYRLIRFLDEHDRLMSDAVHETGERFDANQREIKALQDHLLKVDTQERKAQESVDSWASWNDAAKNLSAAAVAVTGAALIAADSLVLGATLVTLSLADRAVSYLGGYQIPAAWITSSKEWQNKLTIGGEFIVPLCSVVSMYGIGSVLVPRGYQALNTIANVAEKAIPCISGLTNFGKARAETVTADLRRDQDLYRERNNFFDSISAQDLTHVEGLLQTRTRLTEVVRQAVNEQH